MIIDNVEYQLIGTRLIDFHYDYYKQKHMFLLKDNILYVYVIEYNHLNNEIYDTNLEKIGCLDEESDLDVG